MYVQVIVCYDIEEARKRTKLFDALKDLGLTPIQKSVFWGYILPSEKRVIVELFKEYCDNKDRAFVVNAILDKNIADYFGYTKNDFMHPESFEII